MRNSIMSNHLIFFGITTLLIVLDRCNAFQIVGNHMNRKAHCCGYYVPGRLKSLASTGNEHGELQGRTDENEKMWLTPVQLEEHIFRSKNCFIDGLKAEISSKDGANDLELISIARLSSVFADVAYYGDDHDESHSADDLDEDSSVSIQPSLYRLNSNKTPGDELTYQSNEYGCNQNVLEATDTTFRWCDHFVQHLNLCPWAKLSLQSNNAVRIKIVDQGAGLRMMEKVVRDSAKELIDITDRGEVDANVGITFVLAIPKNGENLSQDVPWDFEFEQFYDFAVDLEDRLFDEAEVDDTADTMIGDEITLAPFHPDWFFASEDSASKNPLDYEKKSPYPTISLVRTSVIMQAGEDATGRIGIHNEQTLTEVGSDRLEDLYQRKVLKNLKDQHKRTNSDTFLE